MRLTFTRHEHTIITSDVWRVDEVRAQLEDGTQAGFCRISYVPSERTRGWEQDIYAFLGQRGAGLGIHTVKDPATATLRDWSHLAFEVQHTVHGLSKAHASAWHEKPLPEIQAFLEAARPELEAKLGHKRAEFMAFHVDKPLVDYIQVPPGLQGKRIGRALYQEAARWMAERGLALHASGIQTEAAQRCWDSMRRDGLVEDAGAARVRIKLA